MRHLGSLLLALVLAPATWVLTGVGVSKFAEGRAESAELGMDLSIGLAAMLGAGLCYAVLLLPRLSPLGPVLAGLAFLGMVGWRVLDLPGFTRYVPEDVVNVDSALRLPAEGYAALLAVPLLALLFSARRWRRHEYPPADYPYPQPEYQPAEYQQPAYTPEYPTIADDPTWPLPGRHTGG